MVPRSAFDVNSPAKAITTSGGWENHHPSGNRFYSIRELACLQTFPIKHTFEGGKGVTAKRRQIGNAVPPALAKVLFRAVIGSLGEADAED